MRDEFELSRRKVLAGIGGIGVTSAGAGLGTSAYFNDTETFEGNEVVAGELDLKVDWQEHYYDWSEDENDDWIEGDGFLDDQDESDDDLDGDGVDDFEIVMTNGDPSQVPEGYVGLPAPMEPMIAVPSEFVNDFMRNTAIDALPDSNDDGVQNEIYSRDDIAKKTHLTGDDLEKKFRSQFANMSGGLSSNARTQSGPDGIGGPPNPQVTKPGDPLIEIGDVKPGDFGEVTLSTHLFNNPGYLWFRGELVDAAENETTEPEAESDDETAGVELLDEIRVLVWHDDGDNVLEDPEEAYNPHDDGPEDVELTQSQAIITSKLDGADENGILTLGEFLQAVSSSHGIPLDWDASTDSRDCYPNSTTRYLCFAWWLPADVGNEVQSDSVSFDLGFYTEQCRHNDGSGAS